LARAHSVRGRHLTGLRLSPHITAAIPGRAVSDRTDARWRWRFPGRRRCTWWQWLTACRQAGAHGPRSCRCERGGAERKLDEEAHP